MINCSSSSISAFERGVRVPPTETLILLANYFDVSMDYIMGRTDDPEIRAKK